MYKNNDYYIMVGLDLSVSMMIGWVVGRIDVEMPYHTHKHTHTNTYNKMENMNAVMKCGPEKGHLVVLSQIETKC